MSNTTPAAGWYPDPEGSPQQRFWNGTEWTDQYHSPTPEPSWWQNNRKGLIVAGSIIGGLFLLAGINTATEQTATPTPAVTVTQQAPAPAPAVEDDPVEELSEDDIADLALEVAWDGMNRSAKDDVCMAFNLYPDEAWDAFNEGAAYQFTRRQFDAFFGAHC